MRLNRSSRIVVVLLIALTASTAGAWPHGHAQKAHVHFWATSTVIRSTWSWNEDTYLAELIFPRSNEAVLVRLIDSYPSEAPPLSREILKSDSGGVLPVMRDAACDRPFGEILLRTAPGDPMAILPERLGYRPPLVRRPAPETILPCYRVVPR